MWSRRRRRATTINSELPPKQPPRPAVPRQRRRERLFPKAGKDAVDARTPPTNQAGYAADAGSSTVNQAGAGAHADHYFYPGEVYQPVVRGRHVPTTVVYAATEANTAKPPTLELADPDSLDLFRQEYLSYVRSHGIKQRRRPRAQRTAPLTVIKCIDADCLQHICMYMLPAGQRTRDPHEVSAMDVHQYVMGAVNNDRAGRASTAAAALKALRCVINAKDGEKNVQRLFMEAARIKMRLRVRVAEKTEVKYLLAAVQPQRIRECISDRLHMGTQSDRAARKNVTLFYDLLTHTARVFRDAAKLGLILPSKREGPSTTSVDSDSEEGNIDESAVGNGTEVSDSLSIAESDSECSSDEQSDDASRSGRAAKDLAKDLGKDIEDIAAQTDSTSSDDDDKTYSTSSDEDHKTDYRNVLANATHSTDHFKQRFNRGRAFMTRTYDPGGGD